MRSILSTFKLIVAVIVGIVLCILWDITAIYNSAGISVDRNPFELMLPYIQGGKDAVLKEVEVTIKDKLEGMTDDERVSLVQNRIKSKLIPNNNETATPVEDFEYAIGNPSTLSGDDDYAQYITLLKYNGVAEKVEIPAYIEGKPVMYINEKAFEGNIYLKEVVVPDTVIEIGYAVFSNCTVLEKINCSKNLITIQSLAFENCVGLKEFVTTGDELCCIRQIGAGAFTGCTNLQKVHMEGSAFRYVGIGDGAFADCTLLTDVKLPEYMANIGKHAFANCTGITSFDFTNAVSVGTSAFQGCTGITEVMFGDRIDRIDGNAFRECTALNKVKIGKSINVIEGAAFYGCTSLSEVRIEGRTLTTDEDGAYIAGEAFACTAITELEVPGHFLQIGSKVCANCPNLTRFEWYGTGRNVRQQKLGSTPFEECKQKIDVYLPRTMEHMDYWGESEIANCTIYALQGTIAREFALNNGIAEGDWEQ